jgi:hypothetical protein
MRRYDGTEPRSHRNTTMQIYDALAFFKDAEVDTGALIDFLRELGERTGWDDEQIGLRARDAVETHFARGQASAIKYLESLL